MANTTTTETTEGRKRGALRKTLWFVGLWCAGVAGAMLLALPFRLLIHAAMH